ncbi:MAG: FtsQ-type POTRA domain-containing protein [bacterium]|nr:FtsQ-type POTRA domain-containing protein [bacterium]
MKKRVKRKFNFVKFLSFILIICIIYFIVSCLFSIKTKNIVILNNQYYTDEQIIETAGLEDYPRFILLNKSIIKKKLKKLELIEDVKISKKLGFILKLDIKEKKVLYLTRSTNKYKLSDGSEIDTTNKYNVPLLINYVPSEVEKEFIEEFSQIDNSIISLVSEIEYSKNDFDSKRFIFYMNDGNLVYINTNKMKTFNKYVSIVTKLDNHKGILYLDSGNYFKIIE